MKDDINKHDYKCKNDKPKQTNIATLQKIRRKK